MKRILKSRRGAAMESALFFMLVVFALSMLLLASVSAMGYRNLADERAHVTRREIDEIGRYFVAGDSASLAAAMESKGYTDADTEDNTLTLKNKNGKVVLYIEKIGTQATVWQYSAPPEDQ